MKQLGLTVYKPDKTFPAYTLFAPMTGTSAYLIDMQGNVVHRWQGRHHPGAGLGWPCCVGVCESLLWGERAVWPCQSGLPRIPIWPGLPGISGESVRSGEACLVQPSLPPALIDPRRDESFGIHAKMVSTLLSVVISSC